MRRTELQLIILKVPKERRGNEKVTFYMKSCLQLPSLVIQSRSEYCNRLLVMEKYVTQLS
jgi:hypothetical protein